MRAEAPIVVSVPCRISSYTCSIVTGAGFQPIQVLLGADAQANIALRLFEASGMRTLFTPAPEIFSSSRSLDALWKAAKVDLHRLDRALRHTRFGPVSEARVLKPSL